MYEYKYKFKYEYTYHYEYKYKFRYKYNSNSKSNCFPLGPSATPAPEGKSTAKSVRKYGANSRFVYSSSLFIHLLLPHSLPPSRSNV